MLTTIINFFYMGGYAEYVWSAYAIVLICLSLHWYLPWRAWKKYLNKK